ncbi:thiamine biosynthesis protein ThiS [Campylobacterota bacterium]|nr:thiamine biosynthesis protein ThiS [Campylobacterota bacterium]
MDIIINDEPRYFDGELLLSELLEQLGLAGKFVAVELNRNVISHKRYAETPLKNDDRLEIVTLVGGG